MALRRFTAAAARVRCKTADPRKDRGESTSSGNEIRARRDFHGRVSSSHLSFSSPPFAFHLFFPVRAPAFVPAVSLSSIYTAITVGREADGVCARARFAPRPPTASFRFARARMKRAYEQRRPARWRGDAIIDAADSRKATPGPIVNLRRARIRLEASSFRCS